MTKSREHREGFRDAMDLFESLADGEISETAAVDLTAAAEPPAMGDEYRAGFRQAVNILRKNIDS